MKTALTLHSVLTHFLFYSLKTRACSLRPVSNTPEEFEKGDFTLKTRQMFFVRATPGKFKNATNNGHFGIVFEENSVREIT